MFSKKRFGLMLGLVALALTAVPTVASANTLTDALGNHVPVGTTIEGTSIDAKTTTAVGSLTCKHVKIYGIVMDSGETSGTVHIEMHPEHVDTAAECHRTAGATTEAMVVTYTFQTLHLETGGTNTASFTFVTHAPIFGKPCHFEGTVAAGVAEGGLSTAGAIAGTSGAPCPAGGNFSATFSLYDHEGNPLTLD